MIWGDDMRRFHLKEAERRTLFEMGMWHPHPRVSRRAQALVRLAQGITQTQSANEFGVHLNSVRAWIKRWQTAGLVGLYQEKVEGRPTKLSLSAAQKRLEVATHEGGTIGHIMQCMEEAHLPLLVQPETVARWLKERGAQLQAIPQQFKKSVTPSSFSALRSNSAV